jgi:hypothetical protein
MVIRLQLVRFLDRDDMKRKPTPPLVSLSVYGLESLMPWFFIWHLHVGVYSGLPAFTSLGVISLQMIYVCLWWMPSGNKIFYFQSVVVSAVSLILVAYFSSQLCYLFPERYRVASANSNEFVFVSILTSVVLRGVAYWVERKIIGERDRLVQMSDG